MAALPVHFDAILMQNPQQLWYNSSL